MNAAGKDRLNTRLSRRLAETINETARPGDEVLLSGVWLGFSPLLVGALLRFGRWALRRRLRDLPTSVDYTRVRERRCVESFLPASSPRR